MELAKILELMNIHWLKAGVVSSNDQLLKILGTSHLLTRMMRLPENPIYSRSGDRLYFCIGSQLRVVSV
jgi:hypothetical protein